MQGGRILSQQTKVNRLVLDTYKMSLSLKVLTKVIHIGALNLVHCYFHVKYLYKRGLLREGIRIKHTVRPV